MLKKASGLFYYSWFMKNFLIVVLLVALIGENIYIYTQPDSVCDMIKKQGDEWKDQLSDKIFSDADFEKRLEEEKAKMKSEMQVQANQMIEAKLDSMFQR